MTLLSTRTHLASRHVIDLALGILMGLRGCSEHDAVDDLTSAIHDTGAQPSLLAQALIDVVSGSPTPVPHRRDAMQRWGHLLPVTATTTTTSVDQLAD